LAGSSVPATFSYVYHPAPAPTITAVSPASGTNAGGTVVTISGTNFTGASSVKFGGVNATGFTVLSDGSLTATAPAHAAGTVDITVTTPGGTSAITSADHFSYVAAAVPAVTGISPNPGPTAGGTSVTVTGTGFTGATAVSFGGVAATSFTVNSATQITATAPPQWSGTADVTVTTPAGTSAAVSGDRFTYTNAP